MPISIKEHQNKLVKLLNMIKIVLENDNEILLLDYIQDLYKQPHISNIYIEGSFVMAIDKFINGVPIKDIQPIGDIDLHISSENNDSTFISLNESKLLLNPEIVKLGKIKVYNYKPKIILDKSFPNLFRNMEGDISPLEIALLPPDLNKPIFEVTGVPKIKFSKDNSMIIYENIHNPYSDIVVNKFIKNDYPSFYNLNYVLSNNIIYIMGDDNDSTPPDFKRFNYSIKSLKKALGLWLRYKDQYTKNIKQIIACLWHYDIAKSVSEGSYNYFTNDFDYINELYEYIVDYMGEKLVNSKLLDRFILCLMLGLNTLQQYHLGYSFQDLEVKELFNKNIAYIRTGNLCKNVYNVYIIAFMSKIPIFNINNERLWYDSMYLGHIHLIDYTLEAGETLPRRLEKETRKMIEITHTITDDNGDKHDIQMLKPKITNRFNDTLVKIIFNYMSNYVYRSESHKIGSFNNHIKIMIDAYIRCLLNNGVNDLETTRIVVINGKARSIQYDYYQDLYNILDTKKGGLIDGLNNNNYKKYISRLKLCFDIIDNRFHE